MRAVLLVVFISAGIAGLEAPAQELAPSKIAQRAKLAIALVQRDDHAEGSAFCIHESGLFLTNEHVVGTAREVTLVLNPGLGDPQIVVARVIRKDQNLDLALLKVGEKVPCHPLPLGSSDALEEQREVIALGFPFGKRLATEKGEYPSASVNSGRISSLRHKNGDLDRIQIDAALNPGNSGGPLLDTRGTVIGVVAEGFRGTAVNFAIPVNHVHRFVSTPEVSVQLPKIAYADRFQQVPFEVNVMAPLPAKQPYRVDLVLDGRDGNKRTIAMELNNDVYRASAAIIQALSGPRRLKTTLTYPTGTLHGLVADRSISIGGKSINLADVHSVSLGVEPMIVLTDGTTLKGQVRGLADLSLQLGSDALKLDGDKAMELVFSPPEPDTSGSYTVIVRLGDKELTRVRDRVVFEQGPSAAGTASKVSSDPPKESKKLDGFWLLVKSESKGNLTWPQHPEEGIYIEGDKVLWVKKNGKIPVNGPEADIVVDAAKNPHQVYFSIRRGPARDQKWLAIYVIEGNLLTIATNCDEDTCPSLFTIRATSGGAQFVRTYRRVLD